MIEWSETHQSIREVFRRFVEAEVKPHVEALEHGDLPPYEILRKMVTTFGIADAARAQFASRIRKERKREEALERGEPISDEPARDEDDGTEHGIDLGVRMIPLIELSRWSPGMVTALGVSMGLTPNAILTRGTSSVGEGTAGRCRCSLPNSIGAWAITEPSSGSDAFGAMKSTARRDGDEYVLNGSKTFITNGPYADTIVFICKLDDGAAPEQRKVVSFILDKGTPGLTQSKPLRKMGMHSSPTGELFLEDVRVGRERLIGETENEPSRSSVKATFTAERTGVAAMVLGIVEQCVGILCVRLRKDAGPVQSALIGDFQLIQLKLAKMEVARMNIQNLVFRQIEMAAAGKAMGLAEASACKLYSAQATMDCCLEAVQLFGGNGYMAEFQVEQLCRDAKVLQIYAGTDESQVSRIARSLLRKG